MIDAVPFPDKMLAKSRPDFLEIMETDLTAGMRIFIDAGYRYLLARPPKEFFACPGLEPADFAIQIICALVKDDCRRLRKYRDQGKPFLAWFRTVAVRYAIDIMRKNDSITGPLTSTGSGGEDDDIFDHVERAPVVLGDEDLGNVIRESIRSMGDHPCHRILWMRYVDEYSNQEISQQSPEGWSNVEVGNRFRRCRLRLMEKLKEQGITPDDIL